MTPSPVSTRTRVEILTGCAAGIGVGDGLALGEGLGLGDVPGLGEGLGLGDVPGLGEGLGLGDVPGLGEGLGLGDVPGLGEGLGLGDVPGLGEGLGLGDVPGLGEGLGLGDGPGPPDTMMVAVALPRASSIWKVPPKQKVNEYDCPGWRSPLSRKLWATSRTRARLLPVLVQVTRV